MNQKQLTNHSSVGKHPDRLSHPALSAGRIGHAEEPSDNSAGGFSSTLRSLLLPLAATAVTGLLSVTVMAAAAGSSPDPTALIPALSVAALALSSLAGGITAGLCRRDRAVASSLISGCLLTALLCLPGLLGGTQGADALFSPTVTWLIRLVPIPVCALGGVLTRPRPHRTTHKAGNHPARKH